MSDETFKAIFGNMDPETRLEGTKEMVNELNSLGVSKYDRNQMEKENRLAKGMENLERNFSLYNYSDKGNASIKAIPKGAMGFIKDTYFHNYSINNVDALTAYITAMSGYYFEGQSPKSLEFAKKILKNDRMEEIRRQNVSLKNDIKELNYNLMVVSNLASIMVGSLLGLLPSNYVKKDIDNTEFITNDIEDILDKVKEEVITLLKARGDI